MSNEPEKPQPQPPAWQSLWREALLATTLGWELALPIFAGVLGGYFLDRWLGTDYIFTIGLLFMGITLGYYSLMRFIQRLSRLDREQAEREREEREQ